MRYAWYAGFAVLTLTSGWGMYRAVGFAYSTDRLAIRNVQVRGESRVTESEILARAGFVPGTNALRVDLDQIREDVERLLWVRYAAVHRVWPNELVISVVEREPVGLARISGEIYQVDADGVILPVNAAASPSFPILDGLAVGDGEDAIQANAAKIEIYRETLSLLGEGGLSEVHVSGSGEVSVVPIDDPVVVDLGSTDHRIRWQKYLNLKNRIRDDYPTALRIDLRFKDQVIIQIEGREPAERILWGEETELL